MYHKNTFDSICRCMPKKSYLNNKYLQTFLSVFSGMMRQKKKSLFFLELLIRHKYALQSARLHLTFRAIERAFVLWRTSETVEEAVSGSETINEAVHVKKGTVCSLKLVFYLTSTRAFRKTRDKFRVQNNIEFIGEINDKLNQNNMKVQSSGY